VRGPFASGKLDRAQAREIIIDLSPLVTVFSFEFALIQFYCIYILEFVLGLIDLMLKRKSCNGIVDYHEL
jgi:hypothetical protein